MRIIHPWVAVLATAALALSACGSNDADSDASTSSATIRVWLNGPDTPPEARDWLKETFEKDNPGSTLTIEEQQWEGLVEKLTTSLASKDTPDVVEIGNTQASTFTEAGAFSDLTDDLENLGGDDLLPGFVEGATIDGQTYAVPYYAGSKFVFYRKDLFDKAGLEVPTTLDEFVDTAIELKQANPKPANFSGFWFPGQDWRNGAAFIWAAGGELATEQDGQWSGALSSPEAQEGMLTAQRLFKEASSAAKDGNEADPVAPFCAGEIGMVSAPGWTAGLFEAPDTGCPELAEKIGVFAMPGNEGETAPVLLGGSDIAVAAKSSNQELALEAVELMLSEDYQTMLAQNGLTPARSSLASELGDDEVAEATIAAASNARLTPSAPGWASVESSRIMEDLFVKIASGGDVTELAAAADKQMNATLGN